MLSVILIVLAVEWLGSLALLCLCDDPDEEHLIQKMQVILGLGVCVLLILKELVDNLHIGVV